MEIAVLAKGVDRGLDVIEPGQGCHERAILLLLEKVLAQPQLRACS